MIEKQLQEVLECKPYIPINWATVLDQCKEDKLNTSFDYYWASLTKKLSVYDGLRPFWSSIGLTEEKSITDFLKQFKSITMLTVMYWGLDYIYKKDSSGEIFGEKYVDSIFHEDPDMKERLTFRDYKKLNDHIYHKVKRPAKSTIQITDLFSVHIENEIINDDFSAIGTVNPRLIKLRDLKYSQEKSISSDEKTLNLKSFYPEITKYIQESFRITEKSKIEISSLSRLLALLVLNSADSLPGHRNTKSGSPSLHVIDDLNTNLNEDFVHLEKYSTLAIKDLDVSVDMSKIIYYFAVEDLFHLNRLSNVIELYCEYIKKNLPLSKKQCKLVLLTFMPLLYAPTTEIQSDLSKYAEALANILIKPESYITKDKTNEKLTYFRVLAVNGIIAPLLAYSMSVLLFEGNDTVGSVGIDKTRHEVLELIKTIETENIEGAEETENNKSYKVYYDNLLTPSTKVWERADLDYFVSYEKNKGKYDTADGKKDSIEEDYRYSKDFKCRLPINEVLSILLTEEHHTWKRNTIIDQMKLQIGHFEKVGLNDKVKEWKQNLDEFNYLFLLYNAFAQDIKKEGL